MIDFDSIKYDNQGLVPVIAQDSISGMVLMLGYASRETLAESIEIGKLVFHSRSRNERWLKGDTSGNYLEVVSVNVDCDSDAILAEVIPHGPTCHLGSQSCFGEQK